MKRRDTKRWLSGASLAVSLLLGCNPVDEQVQEQAQAPAAPAPEVLDTATAALAAPGFAELHHHMFAEEAFAGGWFHGTHQGPLVDCDGGEPPSDHARVRQDLTSMLNLCPGSMNLDMSSAPVLQQLFWLGGAAASEVIGQTDNSDGDTGLHLGRSKYGSGWPRWDTIAHQQSLGTWLKSAHDRGLNLVVVSAVSNGFLCSMLPYDNIKRPCDEMVDAELQIQMARQFAANNTWVEIALSPAHARQIIASGKLAMVLSIEVSKLFGSKDWRSELDRFYNLGVRTLQPVHQLDNRFGGAALHNAIFQFAQFTENCHVDYDCGATTNAFTLGFDVDANCRNTRGLTTEGKALLQAMMNKGMLIDVAHLSERGVQDAYSLAQQNAYYPLYVSHGHLREVMNPKLAANEKTTPAWIAQVIRRTGGIFGLRTAHDETRTYTRSGVANSCHGSSRSFAQAYQYGRLGLKVPMAFGADFNGFIQQTRPRFGDDGACSATFKAEADAQTKQQRVSGPSKLGTDFDQKGLAHIGVLPDLISDLDKLGVDTTGLKNSAETFLRMWERANSTRSGMADGANDIDTTGIATYVSRETREQSYPQQCGQSYAPAYQVLGGQCRFNAECESNKCTSAPCDLPVGICICDDNADCATNQYCGWGTNAGSCQNKKSSGSLCAYGYECLSNTCQLTWSGTRCK